MVSENRNHHIVKLSKDVFTRNHINDLKNVVNDLISRNIYNIFLDFSSVENIDQIGFGVLLTIQQIAVRHQIDIKLFGLNQNIKYIIEKAFNSAVFDIFDREEAGCYLNSGNEGVLIA